MNIETTEELAEHLADRLGLYGIERTAFVGEYEDRIRQAPENDKVIQLRKPHVLNARRRTFLELERDRFEWSVRTFPEATAVSSLLKAEEEIREIKADIEAGRQEPQEYADAIMCIFDSAGRQGISPEQIVDAYAQKVVINKARRWRKNPDNTYSHVPYNELAPEEQAEIDRATGWKSTPVGNYSKQMRDVTPQEFRRLYMNDPQEGHKDGCWGTRKCDGKGCGNREHCPRLGISHDDEKPDNCHHR